MRIVQDAGRVVAGGGRAIVAGMVAAVIAVGSAASVAAQEIATEWMEGERHRVRLLAGDVPGALPDTVTAFLEVAMNKGWKTYWKNPGTAGGIPPEFNFGGSKNVAKAEALYPVPQVISDKAGDVIGYREYVMFPIRITPQDPAQPLTIVVTANYGICEKLCVPAEVTLSLDVPPAPRPSAGADAERAYAAVPRSGDTVRSGDPTGFKFEPPGNDQSQSGSKTLKLSATFPGDPADAAVYLAVADGRYIAMPKRAAVEGETVTFAVTMSDEELAALKGERVSVTMKGSKGQSEDTFVID